MSTQTKWWECEVCHERHPDPEIDLENVRCKCGIGAGRWGIMRATPPPVAPAPTTEGPLLHFIDVPTTGSASDDAVIASAGIDAAAELRRSLALCDRVIDRLSRPSSAPPPGAHAIRAAEVRGMEAALRQIRATCSTCGRPVAEHTIATDPHSGGDVVKCPRGGAR